MIIMIRLNRHQVHEDAPEALPNPVPVGHVSSHNSRSLAIRVFQAASGLGQHLSLRYLFD